MATLIFQACSSTGMQKGESFSTDGLDITARGAIGRLEAATGPMWTGDGGKNIRLAIIAPEVQGDVPIHLPIYIQGLLNSNFNKYSAINLIDRQNLNKIIAEQNIAASNRFSDQDFVRIGNLANAQFYLFGTIQKLPGNRFSLQLSITESSTGVRKATFLKEGTLAQLEGRAILLNEATVELLTQLGVKLTEAGKQTLLAGNISTVQAQTGLARGITAQAGGSEVEALFNFAQAITFDPTQIEALSRLNTISTTISGGTISQRIVSDIQARDRWIEAFKETTRFFNDHPPFEIIFDPNLIQIGETDYKKRTATLGMRISLEPSKAGFDALNALLEGLVRTGRRDVWGFTGWPLMDISPRTAGTVVFGGKGPFSYKVDVALINENNKTISKSSITLNTEQIRFTMGEKKIIAPRNIEEILRFSSVKADDLTPTLTIMIIEVNGISSRELASSGYMRIEIGDLEKREKERREAVEKLAQEQRERERIAQEQREKELQQQRERERVAQAQREKELQQQRERERVAQERQQRENQSKAQASFDQGVKNINIRDYNSAIRDFSQAIQLNPNFNNAYFQRALAYYTLGNHNMAIADYNQVIRLNPNDSNTYNNRGNSYSALKNHNQAIADYTQSIRLDPNNAVAFRNRSTSYVDNNQYNMAIADATDAIRLSPNYAEAYNARGVAYERLGDFRRAKADYETALRLDPNSSLYKKNLDNIRWR